MTTYSGAAWLQAQLNALHESNPQKHPEKKLSALGSKVADLLGEWKYGIYHLSNKELLGAQWDSNACIEISIYCVGLATFDCDELTRLVFLAHVLAIRIELTPSTHHYMRIRFHAREHREPGTVKHFWEYHPTLQQAVNKFQESHEQMKSW